MKKSLCFVLALCACASSSFASVGTFGYGIELTGTGTGATNNATKTLYALDTGGGSALTPTGSTGMLSTAWTSASTSANPTFNLGSFNPSAGDTLVLNGGSILTYQNGGSTVDNTSQYLNYGVNTAATPAGSFTFSPGVNLPLDSASATGNAGDQRFATETVGVNLLNGLSPGTYTLATYGYASGVFEDNSGANFAASFVVVPEPGTWALFVLGGALGFGLSLRRRHA